MSVIAHKSDESVEDYLETILILHQKNGTVRSIDIATEMNFSKPSVSVAMKNLRQKNYIEMASDGFITLTESGKALAEKIYERHLILSTMLTELGVEKNLALKDACRIEHDLSDESFAAIKKHFSENILNKK